MTSGQSPPAAINHHGFVFRCPNCEPIELTYRLAITTTDAHQIGTLRRPDVNPVDGAWTFFGGDFKVGWSVRCILMRLAGLGHFER
jgi:hypothetical protein